MLMGVSATSKVVGYQGWLININQRIEKAQREPNDKLPLYLLRQTLYSGFETKSSRLLVKRLMSHIHYRMEKTTNRANFHIFFTPSVGYHNKRKRIEGC